MAERVDLDELARLEEERNFLLTSIADLDREHDAGDVDPDDYDELRDGYVARAAIAIRSIESHQSVLEERRAGAPKRRGRLLATAAGVVAFATVAGVLLAGALGSRGSGSLTGGAGSVVDAKDQCRTESLQSPRKGITCYDAILKTTPDDAEALTYQGWARVRSGDPDGGSKTFDRVVQLDPTFPDVRVFRASVKKNAGDFAGAQSELDALYALNPPPALVSTLRQMGLDVTIAEGLLPKDVSACWTKENRALTDVDTALNVAKPSDVDQQKLASGLADLTIAVKCLDDVVAARPDDVDALTLRSLAMGLLGVIDEAAVVKARDNVEHVLQLRPDDATALLLRSVWRDRLGDLDGASADLTALGDRRVSPLVATYVDRSQVQAGIEASKASKNATTTTTSK